MNDLLTEPLTLWERRLLRELATGATAVAIAHRHGLEVTHVRREVRELRERFGARTTIQAVAIAARHGLV